MGAIPIPICLPLFDHFSTKHKGSLVGIVDLISLEVRRKILHINEFLLGTLAPPYIVFFVSISPLIDDEL